MAIFLVNDASDYAVAILLAVAAMSEAFVNVVADAIMCVQARKDPEFGSQNLISYSWMATALGGLLGCVTAAIMTKYFHPRYSFFLYSFMGLIVSFNGMYLTKASEEDSVEEQR